MNIYVLNKFFHYLCIYLFRKEINRENAKIKQIKADETQSNNTKSLNIMGQQGWELISTPLMGPQRLIFKKKI